MRRIDVASISRWTAVENAPGVQYSFPEKMSRHFRECWDGPAIYRWVVFDQVPGDLRRLYVGEAEQLPRRVFGYLNPGPTQRTNQRLNELFQQELRNGHNITLEVLALDPFDLDGFPITVQDLADKQVRRLLEDTFVVYYSKAGYTLLNA